VLRRSWSRARATAVALAVAAVAVLAVAVPASADVDCKQWSADGRICLLKATEQPPAPGDGDDGDPGGSSGSTGPRVCLSGDVPIDCEAGFGTWSNDRQCYLSVADPQPPADDAAWDGHTDGSVYRCMIPEPGTTSWWTTYVWVAPTEPVVDPADLAQDALAQMEIRAGEIGMNPPATADRMSIVGLQTWLWVADPDQHTVGPITRSVTAGTVTVTANAHLEKIVWDMGDDHPTTCHGPGTPYDGGDGESPTCGHTYGRSSAQQPDGVYTVTATAHWVVDWTGGGQTGSIPVTVSRSAQVRVGEIQTLVTDPDQG